MNNEIPGSEALDEFQHRTNPHPETIALRNQLKDITKYSEELRKRLNFENLLVDKIKDAIVSYPPLKKNKVTFNLKDKEEDEHAAVLVLTDLHGEEVVEADETEGMIEFNWQIFLDRMWAVVDKTIKIVNTRRKARDIKKLYINLLGDIITGEIHDELMRTNSFTRPTAVVNIAHVISQVVQVLASHFDEVIVSGVAGNHGREDKKTSTKQLAERNWDTAIYRLCAMMTDKLPNVTWNITKSYAMVVNVLGNRILLKHGDDVHGGTHPFYPLIRDTAKEADKRRGTEHEFDYIQQGHLHTWSVLENVRFLCPSLMGGSQYANRLHLKSKPAVLLQFYTEKRREPSNEIIDLRSKQRPHQFANLPEWV